MRGMCSMQHTGSMRLHAAYSTQDTRQMRHVQHIGHAAHAAAVVYETDAAHTACTAYEAHATSKPAYRAHAVYMHKEMLTALKKFAN